MNLFFFELGDAIDYLMLVVVIVGLAAGAWWAQRSKIGVAILFVILPVLLTIFWWPHSTEGTAAAGWFPIVKQYSALIGSLSLVALQYVPSLRNKYWYLCIPPLILTVNIAEAVIRDFQCYFVNGVVEGQHIIGGPWNILNGIAGILNILAISGWTGIHVLKNKSKAIQWNDLTIGWIIAYDIWNVSYVYNCLPNRAWYSGVALLASCTIPAFMAFGKGSWIQYRAYTLTLWSGVVLTFPALMHDTVLAHDSSHNPAAMMTLAVLSIAINLFVTGRHFYTIAKKKRNPFTQEVYA